MALMLKLHKCFHLVPVLVGLISFLIQFSLTATQTCSCSDVNLFLDYVKTNLMREIEDKVTKAAEKAIKEGTEDAIDLIMNVVSNIKPGSAPSSGSGGPTAIEPPTEPPIDPTMGTTSDNPIESCTQLNQVNPSYNSGNYWIKPPGATEAVKFYCDRSFTCGGITGGWMKVADWDFSNPSQKCPGGFTTIPSPKRLCDYTAASHVMERIYVNKASYSHVCGKIIGYQNGFPLAFLNGQKGINSQYVFGISLTHGDPKQHIWTFAGALEDTNGYEQWKCPCINSNFKESNSKVPDFVGNDYFCDTASSTYFQNTQKRLITDKPLWDGEGCSSTNTCCTFPGGRSTPPWFYKELPSSTTDYIDLRLMRGSYDGSTPLETVELYIQ